MEQICDGIGVKFNRHAMYYGHTECKITVTILLATTGDRHHVVEAVRAGKRWNLRMFSRAFREFSGLVDLSSRVWYNLTTVAPRLTRRPRFLGELVL